MKLVILEQAAENRKMEQRTKEIIGRRKKSNRSREQKKMKKEQ